MTFPKDRARARSGHSLFDHCVLCHSHIRHPALRPPKTSCLKTRPEMRRFAQQIYMQTVQNRAMPLGNQTGMTVAERDALGHWVNGRQ